MTSANAKDSAPVKETNALLDGQSYLESLRDGREVYIYGERDQPLHDSTHSESPRPTAAYAPADGAARPQLFVFPCGPEPRFLVAAAALLGFAVAFAPGYHRRGDGAQSNASGPMTDGGSE